MKESRPNLNPFAYPSETDFYFLLLIAGIIVLILNLAELLVEHYYPATFPTPINAGIPTVNMAELANFIASRLFYLLLVFLFVSLVFGAATVIYITHPLSIRWSNKLQTLSPEIDSRLFNSFKDISLEVGVEPSPSIELSRTNGSLVGQAFGLSGSYAIKIGSGIPLLMRKQFETFRTIILHELAHVVNDDIGITYFSRSVWIIVTSIGGALASLLFLSSIFLPVLMTILFQRTYDWEAILTIVVPQQFMLIVDFIIFMIVMLASHRGLLRLREFYADWRVALWGMKNELVIILKRNIEQTKQTKRRHIFRFHPKALERLDYINDPTKLFRVRPDMILISGVVQGALLPTIYYLGMSVAWLPHTLTVLTLIFEESSFVVPTSRTLVANKLAPFLNAYEGLWDHIPLTLVSLCLIIVAISFLVANTIGSQVQREAVADLISKRESGWLAYLQLGISAILFALGVLIGMLLAPLSAFSIVILLADTSINMVDFISVVSIIGFLFILLFSFVWFWMASVRFFARRLIGSHVGVEFPKTKHRLLTSLMNLCLGMSLSVVMIAWMNLQIVDTGIENLLGVFLITLLIYGIVFLVLWTYYFLNSMIKKRYCPICGKQVNKQQSIGQICVHCGGELAPWLFAESLSTLNINVGDKRRSGSFQATRNGRSMYSNWIGISAIGVVGLFCITCSLSFAALKWRELMSTYQYEAGVYYVEQGDYRTALSHYENAATLSPNYDLAYFGQGRANYQMNLYAKAIEDLTISISLNPDNYQAYQVRGLSYYYGQGEINKALADLNRALQLNQEDPNIYGELGNIHSDLGDIKAAMSYYDDALRLDPSNWKTYLNRGITYFQQGNFESALADYDHAIALNPQSYEAYNYRGLLYEKEGNIKDAIADYKRSLALYGKEDETSSLLKKKIQELSGEAP